MRSHIGCKAYEALGADSQARLARFLAAEAGPAARLIAAIGADLALAAAQGRFRADLFHRLNVIGIDVQAIREREADSLRLLEHFMVLAAERAGRRGENIVNGPW